jgi:protein O-mannosyl-transferase
MSKEPQAVPRGKSSPGGVPGWLVPALCIALVAITSAVFGQTLNYKFVNLDDTTDVYENPIVRQGLTWKGVVWACGFHSSNWFPLVWLSHMFDCQVFGLSAGGHHLTNVLLHAVTVVLLFLVLRQMTGTLWRSAFVAAIFAVHPLRVESVAWVTERKDVLSGFFFILTIGAYVRYVRLKSPARYALVLIAFALGLMSKAMLITLPLVLLLLDYWPLQRNVPIKSLLLEKLPFLVLSGADTIATYCAQRTGIQWTGGFSLPHRLANAMASCAVYLGQMVWPARLAVFYPFPRAGLPATEILAAGVVLAAGFVVVWRFRKDYPWLGVGWIWYLVMLIPVLGLIQVGGQAHADRFTYLPQIGIYIAITWTVARWNMNRLAAGVLMAGAVVGLAVCARRQTIYWRDSKSLWNHALACTKDNFVAYRSLATELRDEGRLDDAIALYQTGLRINNSDMFGHNDFGVALYEKGRVDEAIAHYETALRINPTIASAHSNLGVALARKGREHEAMAHYQQAANLQPDNATFQNNLAWLLATSADGSLRDGKRAVELAQDANDLSGGTEPSVLDTLAAALAEAGRFAEADAVAQNALKLAQARGQKDLVDELRRQLKFYEAGQPYRE